MSFKGIGWETLPWVYLAQDRDKWLAFVNAALKVNFP
jgi:hypothetical protein